MIDKDGHLHCNKCGKEHALKLEGKLEWYCPRCHFFNRENNLASLIPTWLQEFEKENKYEPLDNQEIK